MGKRDKVSLKRRIIKILKDNSDRSLSAEELFNLVKDTGLHQNFLPRSTNAMGQILRQTKGVSKRNEIYKSSIGNSYVSGGYFLEDEEAFDDWLRSVN